MIVFVLRDRYEKIMILSRNENLNNPADIKIISSFNKDSNQLSKVFPVDLKASCGLKLPLSAQQKLIRLAV